MSEKDQEGDTRLCPGTCNRAFRAAEARKIEHTIDAVLGQPMWCQGCRDQIEKSLRELPRLAASLGSGKLLVPSSDLGRFSKGDVSPSPSPACDLKLEWSGWAERWAEDVATRLDLTVPKPSGSVSFLLGKISYVLSQESLSTNFGKEILRWHRSLQVATGDVGKVIYFRMPGSCPHCDRRGKLTRKNGDGLVKCGSCGAAWDMDHYNLLVKIVVQSA